MRMTLYRGYVFCVILLICFAINLVFPLASFGYDASKRGVIVGRVGLSVPFFSDIAVNLNQCQSVIFGGTVGIDVDSFGFSGGWNLFGSGLVEFDSSEKWVNVGYSFLNLYGNDLLIHVSILGRYEYVYFEYRDSGYVATEISQNMGFGINVNLFDYSYGPCGLWAEIGSALSFPVAQEHVGWDDGGGFGYINRYHKSDLFMSGWVNLGVRFRIF